MKSKILFLALCLLASGVAYIVADTTFSWSQGGQTGTLTYTGLGLASPTISGTVTDTATHSLASNKMYVGNDSGARTAMGVTGDVTITQDGTNATTAIAAGVIVNADIATAAAIAASKLADADLGDVSIASGVVTIDADAVDAANIGTIAQVDTNSVVTTTSYTPAFVGQMLIGTVSNVIYAAKDTTTNGWIQISN